jgi:hypothetical protein
MNDCGCSFMTGVFVKMAAPGYLLSASLNAASLKLAEKAGFTFCGLFDEPEGRMASYARGAPLTLRAGLRREVCFYLAAITARVNSCPDTCLDRGCGVESEKPHRIFS